MAYRHSWTLLSTTLASLIFASLVLSTPIYGAQDKKSQYESYVGIYEITPTVTLSITIEGETLYAQATGQRKFELIWVFDHSFLDRTGNQTVTFVVDDTGKVSSVTYIDPSVLADAVLAGDVDRVRALIEDGADIHALDTRPRIAGGNGRRPLNFASLLGDVQMINTLLELGADINRQNLSGFTPLHHAVEAEALEAIALLVSEGADTTIENNRNLTPEEFAVASGRSQAAAASAEAIGGK